MLKLRKGLVGKNTSPTTYFQYRNRPGNNFFEPEFNWIEIEMRLVGILPEPLVCHPDFVSEGKGFIEPPVPVELISLVLPAAAPVYVFKKCNRILHLFKYTSVSIF